MDLFFQFKLNKKEKFKTGDIVCLTTYEKVSIDTIKNRKGTFRGYEDEKKGYFLLSGCLYYSKIKDKKE